MVTHKILCQFVIFDLEMWCSELSLTVCCRSIGASCLVDIMYHTHCVFVNDGLNTKQNKTIQARRGPVDPPLDSGPRGLGLRTGDLGALGLVIEAWGLGA